MQEGSEHSVGMLTPCPLFPASRHDVSSDSSSAAWLPCHAGLGQTLPETAVVEHSTTTRKKLRRFSTHRIIAADFNGKFSIEIFLKSHSKLYLVSKVSSFF